MELDQVTSMTPTLSEAVPPNEMADALVRTFVELGDVIVRYGATLSLTLLQYVTSRDTEADAPSAANAVTVIKLEPG
jgi:hypothetical protein